MRFEKKGAILKTKVHYKVDPLPKEEIAKKPSKNAESKKMAKLIAAEICGFAPYEKKAIELFRRDKEKTCKRFLKKRLGSLRRAKKKMMELQKVLIN